MPPTDVPSDVRPDARLDFRLPEITRYSWVSDSARALWEPRFEQIKEAWAHVELLSVARGVRRACVRLEHPHHVHAAPDERTVPGLHTTVIGAVAVAENPYVAGAATPVVGQPYALHVAVARERADADSLADAWRLGDQAQVGRLLGYPPCCSAFFDRVWVRERRLDTTWPMAVASERVAPADADDDEFDRVVGGPAGCNILLRWLGVRAVPHLPCSFECERTAELAEQLDAVAREAGLGDTADLLGHALSWPVEWSALHGVAIVKTPVVTVTTTTDATAGPLRVRRRGDGVAWPEHGAVGISFPFREPEALRRKLHVEALGVIER